MLRVCSGLLLFATTVCCQTVALPDISYDPKAPLEFQHASIKDFGYARLLDISYASLWGGRVTGYAVVPSGTPRERCRPQFVMS
jgi:hypothetical protein